MASCIKPFAPVTIAQAARRATTVTCACVGNNGRISRRAVLSATLITTHVLWELGTQPVAAKPGSGAGDWSSPGLAAPDEVDPATLYKTTNGVPYQIISPGAGPAAKKSDRILIDFVLRRANGYFIYATVDGVSFQPRDVPVGPVLLQLGNGTVVPGLEDALEGMMPGGKRRILVPPEVGYSAEFQPQMPTFATKRQLETHKREPLLFEVQMLRVGNQK